MWYFLIKRNIPNIPNPTRCGWSGWEVEDHWSPLKDVHEENGVERIPMLKLNVAKQLTQFHLNEGNAWATYIFLFL